MKKVLFLVALLIAASQLFAQSDYRPGFIVNTAGDTLRGWIDYRSGGKNFKTCSFKKEAAGSPVDYSPADIRGYGFTNDKRHLSRTVETPEKVKETVFLEILVGGKATLYKLGNIFYLEKDTSLVRLANDQYETKINGHLVLVESKKYIGTLTHMLRDCDEIKAKIQRLQLMERPITQIVQAYNKCMGETPVVYKEKKSWFALKPALAVGLEISKVAIIGTYDLFYFDTDIKAVSSPVAELSLDLVSPRINERFSLHVGFNYSRSKYEMNSTNQNITWQERSHVQFELTKIAVPIGIRYLFPERKFTPFINVGVNQMFHVNTQSNRHWLDVSINGDIKEYDEEAIAFKNTQIGYWLGLGVLTPVSTRFGAFLEFRYSRLDGMLDITKYRNPTLVTTNSLDTFQFIVGLRLR
jgi:hypothetical protein